MKSNNTYLNLLASYAYLGKAEKFCDTFFGYSKDGVANVMIDSGAFTLFNSKGKNKWLTLDNYCKFLEKYGQHCEKYVMLDVINNHEESKKNYETMLKRELNPMFVFTSADDDYTYLKQAVANNEHLCVAGGTVCKGDWMSKRFQDVYAKTQAKIHGLGFVSFPKIYQLPLCSVDSSTWIQTSQAFGNIMYFTDKLKSIPWSYVLKRKQKLPDEVIKLLEQVKITPKVFSDVSNHRGSKCIAYLLSMIAYIEYQKYSKRLDRNLFLAVGSKRCVEDIIYTNQELINGTLTYEKFRNQ